jgi:hypothetical protein
MTRVVGLIAVLAAVAVAVYLYGTQTKKEGPSSKTVTQIESQASSAVAATNLQGAAQAMQGWYAANGTYAGATLPPGSGVTLVRADASGYCLQAAVGTEVEHVLGPNGQQQPGAC